MKDASSMPPDEIVRLLERRAAVLAKPPPEEHTGETVDVLVVRVGDERYAIGVDDILEVRPLEGLTSVPGIPVAWGGLVNLRGVLYPVVDVATYLGLERDKLQEDRDHVVVVSSGGLVVGLMVDDVAGFRSVRLQEVEPPLGAHAQGHRKAVLGITPDLLSLLSVETLLEDPALVVDDDAS